MGNIEKEAKELFELTGDLDWKSAPKYGKTSLMNAICQYYLGGITVLRDKLGINGLNNKDKQDSISSQEAKEEFDKLFEE